MLVKLNPSSTPVEIESAEEVEWRNIPLGEKQRGLEEDLECLLADNVNILETAGEGDSETLLIIGRQVVTSTNKRMDLVALDSSGALTLIEVKRDARDCKHRKDHGEIQAVRYAASLAKLRTAEELVTHLYGPYIMKFGNEELRASGGDRSPEEWARKKITKFIDDNDIEPEQLNSRQNIVLIGAEFDPDTKSAAAWMAANGLPIRVIEARPLRLGDTYFLDVVQVIPVVPYEDFYVDLTTPKVVSVTHQEDTGKKVTTSSRAKRLRVSDLFDAGRIKAGDVIHLVKHPKKKAVLTKDQRCEFEGKSLTILRWAKNVTGWSAVNVYDWVIHEPTGKLLNDLREELEGKSEEE